MTLSDIVTGPWAILPETLLELQGIYATHLRGDKIDVRAVEARLGRPLASEQQRYELLDGGVAVLRATGVMAPKANLFMQVSGGVSTQMLTAQFDSMAADPRVKAVVFAPDSPGGNVLGIPAAGKALRALADAKPTVTVVEGVMASAMYWVGSAANAVYIDGETDMVGSIGVVQRLSWEPAAANSMDLVRGRYKRTSVNGQPPTAEVIAQAEAQLDYLYSLFVDTVADHRGTTSDLVLEHMADGRVFIGQQAIDAGLVDGVSTVAAMVEQLAAEPARFAKRRKALFAGAAPASQQSIGAGVALTDDSPTPTAEGDVMPQADTPQITRESLERDHAALFASLRTEFTAAGRQEGATAELSRVKAVLAEGEGMKGHQALVMQLALDGKTTGPEAAQAILAAERQSLAAAARAHHADAPQAAPSAPAADAQPKPAAPAFDASKAHSVAEQARKLVADARAEGRTLTTSQAVAQVMAAEAT
jgi:ClpP class serine protease